MDISTFLAAYQQQLGDIPNSNALQSLQSYQYDMFDPAMFAGSPPGSSSALSIQSTMSSGGSNSALSIHGQTEEQCLTAAIAHENTQWCPKPVPVPFETDPTLIPRAFMRPNAVRASQACVACRKRKVRCVVVDTKTSGSWCKTTEQISRSGDVTKCCGRCKKIGVECVWAEEQRGRRTERTVSSVSSATRYSQVHSQNTKQV